MTHDLQQGKQSDVTRPAARQRRPATPVGARGSRTWRTALIAVAAFAVVLASGSAMAGAATPGGWIVFAATPPGPPTNQLFRIQTSGKGLKQITRGTLPSIAPAFSPDGKKIAFARGGAGIFTMNIDGTGLRRLTTHGRDSFPAWSPDGKQIAFNRNAKLEWHLYVMSASGAGERRLARAPQAGRPSWITAGLLLSTGGDVVKLDPVSGKVVKYLGVEVDALFGLNTVVVSPDASTIAFVGPRQGDPGDTDCGEGPCQRFALYIEDIRKGAAPRKLVPDVGPAAFSPDGKSLVYAAQNGLVIRSLADGSSRKISTGAAFASGAAPPTWQPR